MLLVVHETHIHLNTDTSVLLLPAGSNIYNMMNVTFNNKALSLIGFTSKGPAPRLLANPNATDGSYYFYAEFAVFNLNLSGVANFSIYIGSGYAGAFSVLIETKYFDDNWTLVAPPQSWTEQNLPPNLIIPDGSTLNYIEQTDYPQPVLDTLIVVEMT